MSLTFNELLGYGGTGLTSICLYIFSKNDRLREGLTDKLLSAVNKTKIKKIPLIKHTLFATLIKRESSLATFIIDDPVKMYFYRKYIGITFEQINKAATIIVDNVDSDIPISESILPIINTMKRNINKSLSTDLNIPDKVKPSFERWRAMLTNSFEESIRDIAHDDLFENNYLLAYRMLDVFLFYVTTLLHTGSVEMSRLNGSFKGITIESLNKTQ